MATDELQRRWEAEQANAAEAEAEFYRREQAELDREAAHYAALYEAAQAEADKPAFDWDGYNNRMIEKHGLFPA